MSPHPTPSKPSPGPILGLRPQPFILVALLLFSSIATASPHWIIGGTGLATEKWTPDLGGYLAAVLVLSLELGRTDVAQRRVFALSVVEDLDVLGDGSSRFAD